MPLLISLFGLLLTSSLSAQELEIELRKARNFAANGLYEEALLLYKEHYSKGNRSPLVVNGMNQAYKELKRYNEWISFLKNVVPSQPKNYNLKIILGEAYYLTEQKEQAFITWKEVYNTPKPEIMRFRLTAQKMIRLRLLTEAIAVYEHALKAIPSQTVLNLDIARLNKALFNYEQATHYFFNYVLTRPKQKNYVRGQLMAMGKEEEITKRIIKAVNAFNDKDNPLIKELAAYLHMRLKQYDRAWEIVIELEQRFGAGKFPYLTNFAKEAQKDKAFNWVVKSYTHMLGFNNAVKAASTKLKLAQTWYDWAKEGPTLNKAEDSEARLQKALDLLNGLISENSHVKDAAAELSADIYSTHLKKHSEALRFLEIVALKRISANSADRVRLKKAELLLILGEFVKAENLFSVIKTHNLKSQAMYSKALLYYYNGKFKNASAGFNALVKQFGYRDTLANNALEFILEIEQFSKDSLTYSTYTQAALLQHQQKTEQAIEFYKKLCVNEGALSEKACFKLLKIYKQYGEKQKALTLLKEYVEVGGKRDNADYAQFMLAGLYNELGQRKKALQHYQTLIMYYPNSFYIDDAREKARELAADINKINE